MAEENNQASVEIDTDGVNEETINVETPQEDTTAFEKKEVQKLTNSKTFVLPNTIDIGVYESKEYDILNLLKKS